MMHHELKLQGSKGCPIQVREWAPEGEIKAGLQILHGMAEHCKRYEGFAEYLTEMGYVVWSHDHRQHGYSIAHDTYGILDKEDTWDAILEDVDIVHRAFKAKYPDMPMMMLGHSMGSLVMRGYLQNYPTDLKAAVIMGSPYGPKAKIQAAILAATILDAFTGKKRSKFMDNLAVGGFNKTIKNPNTPFDWISHDMVTVDKYAKDPMCGYPYNAYFYKQMSIGLLMANDEAGMAKFPKIPVLMISGQEDAAGEFGEGVKKVAAAYKQKGLKITLKLLKGMRHEVLNERQRDVAYQEVAVFLESHL